ncbi:16S rRNA (cytidine(1402)-2'-O)-methyltransferase [Brevundimonas sp. 2R-24]|uniref:Ribosomal RNA small subunit methyltransferase I n=1 Tax=Peiella sedimenti TaxID=3061083 RepID=A0ABT8SNI9_9CAUL|nr:16S rRNA (cytidine(1402)-2'-O)-methyltransferase [Caulobacteraceae bacterium XZ-24]
MTPPPPKPVTPGLYLVATPIGNLRDITLRALDVLQAADVVFAEDTRVAGKLLNAYGLSKRVERYDDHVAETAGERVLDVVRGGGVAALISDAGTPLISDPGYRLVRAAASEGLPVHPIPGASSVLAAVTLAGLPTDRFLFAGFLPAKSAGRQRVLEALAPVRSTLVFFETGPRLRACLTDMAAVLGAREAAVTRELTKLHETCVRGSLKALAADPRLEAPKGEIVIVVGPPEEAEAAGEDEIDAALREALTRLGPSEAAGEVAKALNLNRRALYRRALGFK